MAGYPTPPPPPSKNGVDQLKVFFLSTSCQLKENCLETSAVERITRNHAKLSLSHWRFSESWFFISPHKQLLNRRQHSFPTPSQSHYTFQILESWPWLQGNLIITRSAWNTGKAFWPLINVRFRAAKIRFSQILEYSMHCITLGKKRRKRVTLGSRFSRV